MYPAAGWHRPEDIVVGKRQGRLRVKISKSAESTRAAPAGAKPDAVAVRPAAPSGRHPDRDGKESGRLL